MPLFHWVSRGGRQLFASLLAILGYATQWVDSTDRTISGIVIGNILATAALIISSLAGAYYNSQLLFNSCTVRVALISISWLLRL